MQPFVMLLPLLEHEADVSAKDGMTPLQIATVWGRKAVARLLLQKGADLQPKTNAGRTPADWATERSFRSRRCCRQRQCAGRNSAGPSARRVPWGITSGWGRGRGYDSLMRGWFGWSWNKCENYASAQAPQLQPQ